MSNVKENCKRRFESQPEVDTDTDFKRRRSSQNVDNSTSHVVIASQNQPRPSSTTSVKYATIRSSFPQGTSTSISSCSSCETRDAINEAFHNDEILKSIFNCLSTADLLQLSLVNKLWQLNARYILRNSKMCLAVIQGSKSALCKELNRFNEQIYNSRTVPYSGLSIKPWAKHRKEEKCEFISVDVSNSNCENETVNSHLYSSILTKINIKHLKIHECRLLADRKECPVVQFLESVLCDERFRGNLLDISIRKLPCDVPEFSALSTVFGERFSTAEEIIWPNLESFDITGSSISRGVIHWDDKVDQSVLNVKTFVAAPKLKRFNSYIRADNMECVLRLDKVASIQQFAFYPSELSEEKYSLVSQFNQTRKCRLKSLIIFSVSPTNQQMLQDMMMKVCKISVQLLTTNMNSLTRLEIGHLDIVQLIRLRLLSPPLVLTSLTHLVIKFDTDVDKLTRLGERFTLSRIDYLRIFPNLKHLQLTYVPVALEDRVIMQGFWEGADCNFISNSVTEITFHDISMEYICFFIGRISQMFANVKSLHIRGINVACNVFYDHEDYTSHFWIAWPLLEDLSFSFTEFESEQPPFQLTLDSWFTGIPRTLIRDLHIDSDLQDFINQHSSSTYPSIKTLKNLKNLRLQVLHPRRCTKDSAGVRVLFISKLTCLALFAYWKDLTVELTYDICTSEDCRYSFDNLKPYVILRSRRCDF